MNHIDPKRQIDHLRAITAADLGTLLDSEAGLQEALVAAHHAGTSHRLDIDIEAGLQTILPTTRSQQPHSPVPTTAFAGPSQIDGVVAGRLTALDSRARLAIRAHSALDALSLALETTSALVTVGALDHHFRRAVDQAQVAKLALALARTRGRRRAINLAHALAHALDRACGDARALDLALNRDHVRDLYLALDGARRRAHDLIHALEGGRSHVRALTHDLDLAYDLASARNLARDLARNLARDLDRNLARNRALDLDLARDIDRDLDRDLDRYLDRYLYSAHYLDLAYDLASARDLDRDIEAAINRARDLDRARHDFTMADLTNVDLNHIPLTGVRWSILTKWPSDEWRDQALLNSVEIGHGVFEIRGGNTHVPTHTA